jgi:chemotaxis protein methyltransferase CheR
MIENMAPSGGAMQLIGALLEQRTGQQIAANRAWRIETSLKPVLRERGLPSLDALVGQLLGARSGELADQVVDMLLNQETSFFRDVAVLEQIAAAAEAMQAEIGSRRLRIWSAGCSTGQEPLSLAMLFAERANAFPTPPEIVATDVSAAALARARAGRYSQFEIQRGLPVRRMVEWFDSEGGEWVARQDLVRRVQLRQQNLTADAPPPGKFDIILCRNVMLYFSLPLRRLVFERLASAIQPGGLLVLGAGETVIGVTEHFTPSELFRGLYRTADVEVPPLAAAG